LDVDTAGMGMFQGIRHGSGKCESGFLGHRAKRCGVPATCMAVRTAAPPTSRLAISGSAIVNSCLQFIERRSVKVRGLRKDYSESGCRLRRACSAARRDLLQLHLDRVELQRNAGQILAKVS